MKKMLLAAIILGFVCVSAAFALDYTVQTIIGTVEREVSPGKWEALKAGTVLSDATVVNVGLNSSLVLQGGDKPLTINAMQKGALKTLVQTGSSSGIRIGGRVSESNTAVTARGTANVSTASTRASDAAADIELEE
jgi:hypothetical protein